MKDIVEQLEKRRGQARLGGGEKRVAAQHAKGKLTARERIELITLGNQGESGLENEAGSDDVGSDSAPTEESEDDDIRLF